MLWLPAFPGTVSPIVKIPLLLSSAYLVHLANTPPNAPPKPKEIVQDDEDYSIVGKRNIFKYTSVASKAMYWLNAFVESAVILGSRYPAYLSPQLLQLLVREPHHDVSDIRITPVWLTGCLLMSLGSLVRLSCYRTLGRLFTWEITVKDDHKLITAGPYSVVRHPSYAGNIMIGVGTILCHFGSGSWYAAYGGLETTAGVIFAAAWSAWMLWLPTMLVSRVSKEDEILKARFGEEWVAYAKKTPYRLIPFVY